MRLLRRFFLRWWSIRYDWIIVILWTTWSRRMCVWWRSVVRRRRQYWWQLHSHERTIRWQWCSNHIGLDSLGHCRLNIRRCCYWIWIVHHHWFWRRRKKRKMNLMFTAVDLLEYYFVSFFDVQLVFYSWYSIYSWYLLSILLQCKVSSFLFFSSPILISYRPIDKYVTYRSSSSSFLCACICNQILLLK